MSISPNFAESPEEAQASHEGLLALSQREIEVGNAYYFGLNWS
jgi:hypothetical protein